jgi:hypothetical protein
VNHGELRRLVNAFTVTVGRDGRGLTNPPSIIIIAIIGGTALVSVVNCIWRQLRRQFANSAAIFGGGGGAIYK